MKSIIIAIAFVCISVNLQAESLLVPSTSSPVNSILPNTTSSSITTNTVFLHTGFTFDVVLKTQIVSYNVATPVIVETEFDIIYLKKTVIPKGSKVIGVSSTIHSDDRVSVTFHTIVFPDGTEIKFSGIALLTDGSAGVTGEVKQATYKSTVNTILNTAGSIIPGVGGDIAKGIAGSGQQQLNNSVPDTVITVKKDTGLLVYNINRVEYTLSKTGK